MSGGAETGGGGPPTGEEGTVVSTVTAVDAGGSATSSRVDVGEQAAATSPVAKTRRTRPRASLWHQITEHRHNLSFIRHQLCWEVYPLSIILEEER